ncbi:hypothetical protein E4T39_05191 [Aureobasidium subglaciale]|nr:hypothetical protein E4T39_05191 [Aureobasidium subglaciale]
MFVPDKASNSSVQLLVYRTNDKNNADSSQSPRLNASPIGSLIKGRNPPVLSHRSFVQLHGHHIDRTEKGMNLHNWISLVIPITYLSTASLAFYILLNLPQRLRNLCFPIFVVPAWQAFTTFECFTWPASLGGIWALAVLIWMAHLISLLYIDRIAVQSKNRKQWDIKAAYKLFFDVRHLDKLRTTSSSLDKPVRGRASIIFVASRLLRLLVYWQVTVHLFTPIIPLVFGPVEPWEFDQYAQTYFRRLPLFEAGEPVTLRETCIRIVFTFRWIWLSFVDVDGAHVFLSIIFVGVLGLDSPGEWPSMFGSPLEAYTLRRYWGKFWHRLVHKPYLSIAKVVSNKLHIGSPGSRAEKTFLAFLIFLISGIAHAMISLQRGKPTEAVDDMAFYCINFLVIAIEGMTLDLLRPTRRLLPQWLCKMTGYIWVFTFWFWAAPKWSYPEVHGQMLREIEKRNRAQGLGMFANLLSGK